MYESVLRTANNNPDFKFQTTTVPFPTLYQLKERGDTTNAFNFSFMVSVGLALVPCVMVSFILKEREESLKHM
jgi:ATP-binding cassette, subfamily A (ABC1), member 3